MVLKTLRFVCIRDRGWVPIILSICVPLANTECNPIWQKTTFSVIRNTSIRYQLHKYAFMYPSFWSCSEINGTGQLCEIWLHCSKNTITTSEAFDYEYILLRAILAFSRWHANFVSKIALQSKNNFDELRIWKTFINLENIADSSSIYSNSVSVPATAVKFVDVTRLGVAGLPDKQF